MSKIILPEGKKFAFTIIDDTDDATYENIKPVYDVLLSNGLKTTKTVWVYPPRDIDSSKGDSLQKQEYLMFVLELLNSNFEIGIHNVGSGDYIRDEIIDGLNDFKDIIGIYPYIHVNHSYNKDNIYSGSKRFSSPLSIILKLLYPNYDGFEGDNPNSKYFWGDLHKKYIKYARNYEIDNINTLKIVSEMPYKDNQYDKYSNYWFASTFAPNPWMFNRVVTKNSINKLEEENGICILYTHLGYFARNGKVDSGFRKMIEHIGSNEHGWYVPVGTILDHLLLHKKKNDNKNWITHRRKKFFELHSLLTRIKYRYLIKKDDYFFKQSKDYV